MLLTLYDQWGNKKADLQANDSSTQDKGVQTDNVLSLGFTLYEHVSIDVNDYVDYLGERYWAIEKYEPAEKSSVEWEYGLKLYGIESLIKRFLVLNDTDGENEAVFTLTARAVDHVRLIVKCINDGMGTTDFKVGSVEGTDNVVINYEGKYCDEALKELAEAVGVEWWFDGETLNLSRCEWGSAVVLGYGEGLTGLERDKADNVKLYTRLFPIGSSRNIDRERYGSSRLQLPGGAKYVDMGDLVQKYGVIHHYEQEAFSGVYPRRVGVVSSVRSMEVEDSDGNPYTIYYFKDEDLPFDPNDYEIGGLVKHVSFQEGSELAGLGTDKDHYFEVNFNSQTREFEIITIWPYDDGRQLPGDTLVPKPGDKYILWNIRMPDEYYTRAETEYLAAVEAYNRRHTQDVSLYKAPTDHVWIEESGTELEVGRRVRLKSPEYFPEEGYRESRITRISRSVNLPSQMDLEISDVLSSGTLEKIDDAISDAKSYAGSILGAVNVPDVIKSWEKTKPTDTNLYSARRSHMEFLSKKASDTAQGLITFIAGLHSEAAATFGEWLKDVAGAGIYQDDQGNWHIESDYLHARKKLVAKELQIEEVTHVGGQQLLSAAEMVCDYVVEHDTFYRCYFLKEGENGRKIYNNWASGDQARMQSFNVEEWETGKMNNRYYWRLVVGTSNDTVEDIAYYNQDFSIDFNRGLYLPDNVEVANYHFIDLSKSDCDTGSDIPMEGDKIIQLGHRTDATRQNAIMLAGAGTASPYIDEYVGINSYTLEGKCQTRIKPNENLFTGKMQMNPDSTYDGQSLANIFSRYNTNLAEIISQMQAYGSQIDEISNGLNDVQDGLIDIQESIDGLEDLSTGNENLLRNTGFTGDYETEDMDEDIGVRDDTQVYSDPLKYWTSENATVIVDINSASGFSLSMNNGSLSQDPTKPLVSGDWYNVSFRASGTYLELNVAGFTERITLSNTLKRYSYKFKCSSQAINIFSITSATARVMEIQLSAGSIPNVDWIPSPLDNSKAIAYYQDLVYLANAMAKASTSIFGGLILTNMIRVGNYRDSQMIQETGGMSGTYNSGNSPFLWGGGTMEQAFYTIGKYAQDPSYQATPQEISQMANFVVTHGGRAILNDIVLRGYVYALGGYFRGSLEAGTSDKLLIDAATGILRMNGYASIIDGTTDTPDETSERIDFLKLFYQVDPDSLYRIGRLLLNSKIGHVTLDAVEGLNHSSNGQSQSIARLRESDGLTLDNLLNTAQLSADELFMANKQTGITFRFDGSSARWFRNGVQTMGGVITVDDNGFLKLLRD